MEQAQAVAHNLLHPVDTNGNGKADLGELITFSFDLTNTGNVSLVDVTVLDTMVGGFDPNSVDLAPGDAATITAEPYEVTQDDIDAGGVLNTATARGTVPGGDEVVSDPDTEEVPTVDPAPRLELVKAADLDDTNANALADEGETIAYSFVVTNIGNVTLFDVDVADPKVTGLDPQTVTRLAPGASVVFTADLYTVTGQDVAAGEVINHATATGTPPGQGTPVTDDDTVTTKATGPAPAGGTGDTTGLPATGSPVSLPVLLMGLALSIIGVMMMASRRDGAHHRS